MQLKKFIRRTIRYNGFVERAQQMFRLDPKLYLAPIALEIVTEPSDIFIDCGANVGDVTSSFARTGGTVYAFEPDPLCFSVLSKRFSLTPNVTCFHKGVMDRNCEMVLSSPIAHEKWDDLESTVASSFLHASPSHARQSTVECIDLSEFVFSLNKRIRVLKIDIEGAEIPVVNRLIDTKAMDLIDLAVVETHEKQQPSLLRATTSLRKHITDSGYGPKFRLDWI